jgi:hypothetical protein
MKNSPPNSGTGKQELISEMKWIKSYDLSTQVDVSHLTALIISSLNNLNPVQLTRLIHYLKYETSRLY